MDQRTCAQRSGEQPTNKGGILSGSARHDRLKTSRGSHRPHGRLRLPPTCSWRLDLNPIATRPTNAYELSLFGTSMRLAWLALNSNHRCSMAEHVFEMVRRCNRWARRAMFARRGHGPKALRCNRHGARSFVASIQMIGSRRSSAHCKISGVPPRPWAGAPSHMVSTASERFRVSNPAAT
jgi:hypothetical protein